MSEDEETREPEDAKETRRFQRDIHFQETESRLRLPLDLNKQKPAGGIEANDFIRGIRSITKGQFRISFPHPFLVQSQMPLVEADQDDPFFDTVYEDTDKLPLADADSCLIFPIVKRGVNSFSQMITVGRTLNNDLVIPHPLVSKFHAYFRFEEGHWIVRDANSKNGTFVSNKRLEPNVDHRAIDKCLVSFSKQVSFLFFNPDTFWTVFLE